MGLNCPIFPQNGSHVDSPTTSVLPETEKPTSKDCHFLYSMLEYHYSMVEYTYANPYTR